MVWNRIHKFMCLWASDIIKWSWSYVSSITLFALKLKGLKIQPDLFSFTSLSLLFLIIFLFLMVSFIYIVCMLSTQKHSSFQSDNNVATLFSWNSWPICSVFHFPTLERGIAPMTVQTSSERWLACRLSFGALMGSGGDCSKQSRAGAIGRDFAIWNVRILCQIFRETWNLWILTCLNLKLKTVQAKWNFPVWPRIAKCSSLWPLVCTVS